MDQNEHEKRERKESFRYFARSARSNALMHQRSKTYSDDSKENNLLIHSKEFDTKLHDKLKVVNAAHRDLDSYIIEAFKEAEGNREPPERG